MSDIARYGTVRKDGMWSPVTPANWAARRLACCEDTVRGGHRPPLGTPKQLKARDICKGCEPAWRGQDALDTWEWLVTPSRWLSSETTRGPPVRERLGEGLSGGGPEGKRGDHR